MSTSHKVHDGVLSKMYIKYFVFNVALLGKNIQYKTEVICRFLV